MLGSLGTSTLHYSISGSQRSLPFDMENAASFHQWHVLIQSRTWTKSVSTTAPLPSADTDSWMKRNCGSSGPERRGFLFSSVTLIDDVAASLTADPPLGEGVTGSGYFLLQRRKLTKVGCHFISCLWGTRKQRKVGKEDSGWLTLHKEAVWKRNQWRNCFTCC